MKKIITFVILSFLLNTKVFGVENKQNASKQPQSIQFTKKDYLKTAAASLGTLFFATAALRTPALNHLFIVDKKDSWFDIPAVACAVPFGFIFKSIEEKSKFFNTMFGISGTTSGALTGILATYVGKKLYQWKQAKSFKVSEGAL